MKEKHLGNLDWGLSTLGKKAAISMGLKQLWEPLNLRHDVRDMNLYLPNATEMNYFRVLDTERPSVIICSSS
jgi:hypothetical protein